MLIYSLVARFQSGPVREILFWGLEIKMPCCETLLPCCRQLAGAFFSRWEWLVLEKKGLKKSSFSPSSNLAQIYILGLASMESSKALLSPAAAQEAPALPPRRDIDILTPNQCYIWFC